MTSKETIAEMASRIGREFRPRRVILFGSYARGDATEESDVDLLVVVDEPRQRGKRSASILRLLAEEYAVPVDVIVRTMDSLERESGVPGTLGDEVSKEGIILYEGA